jgi:heme oxygenase
MILTLLKDQTQHLHDRIERTVDLPSRLGSMDAYAELLARFYGFYAPLEARLAAVATADEFEAVGLDLAERQKAPLLRADLAALGWSPDGVDALPRCASLPTVGGIPEALGCLYVLEGATLGGQIIRRQAESRLGLGPSSGCSFFCAYGEQVGPKWREFRTALADYAQDAPESEGRVLEAAAETFARLDSWLAGGLTC